MEQQRLDCLPFLRVPYLDDQGHWVHCDLSDGEDTAPESGAGGEEGLYFPPEDQELLLSPGNGAAAAEAGARGGSSVGRRRSRFGAVHMPGERPSLQTLLQGYMESVHAPVLMQPLVQLVVVALFVTSEWAGGRGGGMGCSLRH